MKWVAACALLLCLEASAQTGADAMPWQSKDTSAASRKTDPVEFLDPPLVTVPAGKATVVDLHFRIADGLHINSHTPHDVGLIPTQVAVMDGNGLKTQTIDFPAGKDASFAFAPKEKLSVYQGDLVLKAHIVAARGNHEWQGVLRYQACNTDECLPPRKLPIVVDVIAK
jgi:DsbC/DsbD-like thiol-disulfide interchange protein